MAVITMLGLDPSLTSTGWAVGEVDLSRLTIKRIIDMGTVFTDKGKNKNVRKSSDDLARTRLIATTLNGVIKDHNIKVGASEVPSGGQSASAARAFGIVTGVLASLPIPLIEVTPTEVKVTACNSKVADKEDMVRWAVNLTKDDQVCWKYTKNPNDWEIPFNDGYVVKTMEHQADAIGALNAAVKSQQFAQLAGMMNSLI